MHLNPNSITSTPSTDSNSCGTRPPPTGACRAALDCGLSNRTTRQHTMNLERKHLAAP